VNTSVSRRAFLSRSGALAGGLALSAPLLAFAERVATGAQLETSSRYGPLLNKGDLWLPRGFNYTIVSREGQRMKNGDPTPSRFDGMAAFDKSGPNTVLIRNHENRSRAGVIVETETSLHHSVRYDPDPSYNGGVIRLVVNKGKLLRSEPVLGGTTHNCAGGTTPWGTWITCEEIFWPATPTAFPGAANHGYIFEVGAIDDNPTAAVPIKQAGRFDHEAVSWSNGALYETEDAGNASFYRYVPRQAPTQAGDLLASTGPLQALVIDGLSRFDTRLKNTWPGGVGASVPVSWIDVPNPDPTNGGPVLGVRGQAQALGAAIFARTEGCWAHEDKVYFDCTTGGSDALPPNGFGQIFELDTARSTLTLLFESHRTEAPGPETLIRPDNLTISPVGDLLMCEDTANALGDTGDPPCFIRGLTRDGLLYPLARSETNPTEFCGACFDGKGEVLYVNQQGRPNFGIEGVTYAIMGPWLRSMPPRPKPTPSVP
jgi:uncharacterized protein